MRRLIPLIPMLAMLVLGSLAACSGDMIDALVVVQETNNACQRNCPPPCPAEYEHTYEISASSGCFGGGAFVCSHEPLCQAQLDAAIDPLLSCDELHSYDIEVPAECD
jgi:hypothetical protein